MHSIAAVRPSAPRPDKLDLELRLCPSRDREDALQEAWLAALELGPLSPSLRAMAAAARLAVRLRDRGDYAPAPQPGVARVAPHWSVDTQWVLAAVAELLPGSLLPR